LQLKNGICLPCRIFRLPNRKRDDDGRPFRAFMPKKERWERPYPERSHRRKTREEILGDCATRYYE